VLALSLPTASPSPPPLRFEEVFRAHAPFVWRCLRRLGVAAADADDVTQEVFVIVHRKLHEYDGRASLRAWIYGIARRKAADHRELSHKRHEATTDELPDRPRDSTPSPESASDRRRKVARLDDALAALDEPKRAAFVLYEIEGLSLAEIATATETAISTVHARLDAARKQLRAALTIDEGSPA
jgi:RNA polymerase sigma-70 factor (ECF subfamily)